MKGTFLPRVTVRFPCCQLRRCAAAGSHVEEETVYFTDRGIEELEERRGDDEVTLAWLADRMRAFVDLNPEFEDATERLATFLARDDTDED